jgi:hypothetical protein
MALTNEQIDTQLEEFLRDRAKHLSLCRSCVGCRQDCQQDRQHQSNLMMVMLITFRAANNLRLPGGVPKLKSFPLKGAGEPWHPSVRICSRWFGLGGTVKLPVVTRLLCPVTSLALMPRPTRYGADWPKLVKGPPGGSGRLRKEMKAATRKYEA